ncbi:amino acid synthesis family protein [Nocardia sp. NPDC004168]|uniref:amino acid synthesis family protein n=1 Tax=Nocardia sp. NPDC004168 TaxID=3154452 RepID=UPI0033A60AD8
MSQDLGIRKFVDFDEEVQREYGVEITPPLRRSIAGAVVQNPLVRQGASADLTALIDLSVALGEILTRRVLERVGAPASLRAYGKAVLVGTAGDLEHGAAMIHPRLGMAMRATVRRGKVLIPGNAKVASPGATIDVLFGPLDEGWDLDAMDTMPVQVADSPRSDEILLLVAYATGPRPNARSKGPAQAEVDTLLASFD